MDLPAEPDRADLCRAAVMVRQVGVAMRRPLGGYVHIQPHPRPSAAERAARFRPSSEQMGWVDTCRAVRRLTPHDAVADIFEDALRRLDQSGAALYTKGKWGHPLLVLQGLLDAMRPTDKSVFVRNEMGSTLLTSQNRRKTRAVIDHLDHVAARRIDDPSVLPWYRQMCDDLWCAPVAEDIVRDDPEAIFPFATAKKWLNGRRTAIFLMALASKQIPFLRLASHIDADIFIDPTRDAVVRYSAERTHEDFKAMHLLISLTGYEAVHPQFRLA